MTTTGKADCVIAKRIGCVDTGGKFLQPKVATEGKEVVLHVACRVTERVEDALPFVPVRFDGRDERA